MRDLLRRGEPFIWLTGGALSLSLLMVAGIVLLVCAKALGFFWPADLLRYELKSGEVIVGQLIEQEEIPEIALAEGMEGELRYRTKVKRANRDLYGSDFVWFDDTEIVSVEPAPKAMLIERLEWGDFYGFPEKFSDGGEVVAEGREAVMSRLEARLPEVIEIRERIREIQHDEIGRIAARQEEIRLELIAFERDGITSGPRVEQLRTSHAELQARFESLERETRELRRTMDESIVMSTAEGRTKEIALADIVRWSVPTSMGMFEKIGAYIGRFWHFVSEDPREANTEGGVFPAIFGTVIMVLLMSIVTTPLGILAAFYLREYARQGPFVSAVRIAVNNLAGVPSIVFGVFGVGFFIYMIGGSIDQFFFSEKLPTPTYGTGGVLWASLTLAFLTLPVVIVATEEGLAGIPTGIREGSLALGATKLETTIRVVLPAVLPAIMTGLILAIARAAGEVAPLMITGVVKLAPNLPLDGIFPYLHLERKFMHLGFHIYDVGFQSPNSEAARPMVFATTFLLLAIVVALNLVAIMIRNRLRKRFTLSAV